MSRTDVFSELQNGALRVVLFDLRKQVKNQSELGRLVDTAQQNVARLLIGDQGFSYWTGTLLARHAGFSGVDSFFVDRGVAIPPRDAFFADRGVAEPTRRSA